MNATNASPNVGSSGRQSPGGTAASASVASTPIDTHASSSGLRRRV
jgi:hypothetical protein